MDERPTVQLLGLDVVVDRHLPQGKQTVGPADIVAIEVMNASVSLAASSLWPSTIRLDRPGGIARCT
jgi:hypothetical protein